jgi:hypothetical protein
MSRPLPLKGLAGRREEDKRGIRPFAAGMRRAHHLRTSGDSTGWLAAVKHTQHYDRLQDMYSVDLDDNTIIVLFNRHFQG